MPFLKKRRTRRSSKRASKARRYLSIHRPKTRSRVSRLTAAAYAVPEDNFPPSRHAAGFRFFLRIAPPRPPQLETRLKGTPTCPFAARTRRSMHCAFRNPRGRTASSVRHAAGSRFFLRIAPPRPPQLETRLKGAPTCPFAARTRQSMHCAFRNPRGRTTPSVPHAAGSRSRPRSHV